MTNKTRARVFSVFQRARRMVSAKLAPASRKRNDRADDCTDSDSDSDGDDSVASREWGIVHAPLQDDPPTRPRTDHLSLTTTHGGVQVTLVISVSAQRRASPDLHLQRTQVQWIFAAADGRTPTRRLFQKPMYAVAFVSASHFRTYVACQLEVASRRHAEWLAGSSVPLTPRSQDALPAVGSTCYRAALAEKLRLASTHSAATQLSMNAITASADSACTPAAHFRRGVCTTKKQQPRPTKISDADVSASADSACTPVAHFRRGVCTAKKPKPRPTKISDADVSASADSACTPVAHFRRGVCTTKKPKPRQTKISDADVSASADTACTPAAHFRRGVCTATKEGPKLTKTSDAVVSVSSGIAHTSACGVGVPRECSSRYMNYEASAAYMAKRKLNVQRRQTAHEKNTGNTQSAPVQHQPPAAMPLVRRASQLTRYMEYETNSAWQIRRQECVARRAQLQSAVRSSSARCH